MVIRPTTPRTKPPCVMTTGVWYGQRPKFQSPRHVKVTPNQYTTEVTAHSNSVKGQHVSAVYVPVTPSTRVIFFATLEFPDCTDSLIKGGPRRESVWLALRKTGSCSSEGLPLNRWEKLKKVPQMAMDRVQRKLNF